MTKLKSMIRFRSIVRRSDSGRVSKWYCPHAEPIDVSNCVRKNWPRLSRPVVEAMITGAIQIASLGDYPIMVRSIESVFSHFHPVLLAFDGKSSHDHGISVVLPEEPGIKELSEIPLLRPSLMRRVRRGGREAQTSPDVAQHGQRGVGRRLPVLNGPPRNGVDAGAGRGSSTRWNGECKG